MNITQRDKVLGENTAAEVPGELLLKWLQVQVGDDLHVNHKVVLGGVHLVGCLLETKLTFGQRHFQVLTLLFTRHFIKEEAVRKALESKGKKED